MTNVRVGFENDEDHIPRVNENLWTAVLAPHQRRIVFINPREFGHVRISLQAVGYRPADETFEALQHNFGQQIFITLKDSPRFDPPDFDVAGYSPLGRKKFHTYRMNRALKK